MEGEKKGSTVKLEPKHGVKKFLWRLFFSMLLLAALVFYWFFYRVYNSGNYPGKLVKFSLKGNVFKTYEGEIIGDNNFFFSVTNKSLGDSLEKVIDKNIM